MTHHYRTHENEPLGDLGQYFVNAISNMCCQHHRLLREGFILFTEPLNLQIFWCQDINSANEGGSPFTDGFRK